jgi:hypothetical protein
MKVRPQYGVETYLSEGGYLVIRQEITGEEATILLSPQECFLLSVELKKLAQHSTWWSGTVSDADPVA